MDNKSINVSHEIKIFDRKNINITGVIKIDSFDDEEFFLNTNMGHLLIKGNDLELVKLDTHEETILLKGNIINLSYIDDIKQKSGFLEKFFK